MKKIVLFVLTLTLFSNACKSKNEKVEEEKVDIIESIIESRKSAHELAQEFVEAGLNGDFKKIAELSCKDNGLYMKFEEVRHLDLGDLGFIEKIVREERSEVDPDNLKIIVARLNVLGKVVFRCFYVFNTPKGYKIYLASLFEYPTEKELLAETAVRFYSSNNYNLRKASEIAEYIVNSDPNNVAALYRLGYIYSLMGRKEDALAQYKRLVVIDRRYAEHILSEEDLLSACEELLTGGGKVPTVIIDKEIRYFVAEKLYNMRKDERAVPVLMEKWSEILFERKSEEAAEMLVKISGTNSIPYLSKALRNKICVQRICRIFEELGDERAIPALKEAVYFDGYVGGQLAAWPLAILSTKIGQKDLIIPIIKDALGNQLLVSPNYQVIGYLNALAYLTGDESWKEFANGDPHYSLSKMSFVINAESYSKESDMGLLQKAYLDRSAPNYSKILDWVLNRWREFKKEDESIDLELEKIIPNGPLDITLVFSVLHHIYERDGNKRKRLLDEGYFVMNNSKASRVNLFGRGGFSSWDMRKYLEKNKLVLKRIGIKWIIMDIQGTTEEPSREAPEEIEPEKPIGEVLPPVRAVGEIKPPKLLKKVDYVYPEIAKQEGVEGVVILEVTTDVYGRVQNVKVLRSIPLLDQAAIDAVRKWIYEPVIIGGKPRGVIFTVNIRFRLLIK